MISVAVKNVIRCGGDADTTAAIVGGIIGAAVGKDGIPAAWLDRLFEWPRSVTWMEQLGHRLESARRGAPLSDRRACLPWGYWAEIYCS